jgi:peroxiredoxin
LIHDTTSIARQVDDLHAEMAKQAPLDILAAFTSERDGLDTIVLTGLPAVGSALPSVPLLSIDGSPTTLDAARDGKPAVVVFYRGGWCPYCNIALKTYQSELVPVLDELGVRLIAISPQKPDASLSTQQKLALNFTVLSDPSNAFARELGIVTPERGEDARAAVVRLGIDIPGANADGTDAVPMPTAIVVRADGTVAWIDVHPNYAKRTEVAQIVAALRTLPA